LCNWQHYFPVISYLGKVFFEVVFLVLLPSVFEVWGFPYIEFIGGSAEKNV